MLMTSGDSNSHGCHGNQLLGIIIMGRILVSANHCGGGMVEVHNCLFYALLHNVVNMLLTG